MTQFSAFDDAIIISIIALVLISMGFFVVSVVKMCGPQKDNGQGDGGV